MLKKLRNLILGAPRDVTDPHVFHHVSLIAFLAWVGLGADGLSSSAYGPDEAYRALGGHTHLALFLVLMTAVTVMVISIAYSNLIQHFPGGGGGYLVATKLLGPKVGLVSGCALLVDYVLTISVSVAGGCDAIWSFLPPGAVSWKLGTEVAILLFLVILNLRGVKESVTFLTPIFMLFLVTHAVMIGYAFISRVPQMPVIFHDAATDLRASLGAPEVGLFGVFAVLMRAYSMGGGTYTGIEAVSNGVSMLREPRVKTGRRTMLLMAISLAITAGGILFGYLLVDARPVEGKTLNAVLLEKLFLAWHVGGVPVGQGLVILTLVAAAMLLFVAAQTGFLDGPRVLANMAVDSWMPHRFAQLSDRLVTNNGIYLMGLAAIATLIYTRGDITMLVTMYAVNVFITFSLTELGMSKHWIEVRKSEPKWKRLLGIHGLGLVMCATILTVTVVEKFFAGAWVTLVVTGAVITFSALVRRHYNRVNADLKRLDEILTAPLPPGHVADEKPMVKSAQTAVLTVSQFSGFGLHQLLSIQKLFPNYFKNFIFISVGVVDSGNFKGGEEIKKLENDTRAQLERYVAWCREHGLKADYRMDLGTEAVQAVEDLCREVGKEFPRAIFFTGKLIFQREKWYHRLLHNETAFAIQRRLQFDGLQTIVLPIRAL